MKNTIELTGYMVNDVRPNDILGGYFFGQSKKELDRVNDESIYHKVYTVVKDRGTDEMVIKYCYIKPSVFRNNILGYLIKE